MPTYKKGNVVSKRLQHIHVPVGPSIVPAAPTFLQSLVKRLIKVVRFFNPPPEPSLQGRIHELKSHADDYQMQLEKIKAHFDRRLDPEAYTFVEAIIDPLLKECGSIQSALLQGNAMQQAKAFKKYGEWIDRARVWVLFHARIGHKQEIIDGVVHYLIGAALTRIDRDCQVIQDYQVHQFANLQVSQEERKQLALEVQNLIQPCLAQLQMLKQRPEVISLAELAKWKEQIDEYRQVYFEKALHIIDGLVERKAPLNYSAEANEHLFDAISETTYLEREVQELRDEMEKSALVDVAERNLLFDHLTALADEVHHLTLDLRLGWDLIERLQQVAETIATLRAELNKRYPS